MKKEIKKSKRSPGPFNFCPKHNVFYASCGCKYKDKKVDDDEEIEPIEDKN